VPPSSSEQREVVVLGAGIAGLSAAWELRDRDIVVLEAGPRVGGRIKSESRGRYWLNFGAHVFAGPDSISGRLIDAIGVEAALIPGNLVGLAINGGVATRGRVETFPFRLPLSARARASFVRAGGKLRLAVREYQGILRRRPGESDADVRRRVLAYRCDATFADFLGRAHPDALETFRATINRSTAEPGEISAGAGIGYFSLVWSRDAGLTRNIMGGSSTLPEALAVALGEKVVLGARVEQLSADKNGVRMRLTKEGRNEELSARYAVVATPAYETRRIVRSLPEDTASALEQISYGPYVVMALLTGEEGPAPWDDVYAIATPKRSFNMFFNHANVLRAGPGGREPGGSLMVYAGAGRARQLLDKSDEEIVQTYLRDLYDLFPELNGFVQETVVQRWERALAHVRPGRHLLQDALERPLGNIFLAGDYLGSFYTETAAQTGFEAAAKVRQALASDMRALAPA
jgi:protoporphyrinogen/coproporphyrinogen III oxidase